MPFVPHASFDGPEDDSTTIWRYVDLARFLDMVIHRQLTFVPAQKMADKYEGTLPPGGLLQSMALIDPILRLNDFGAFLREELPKSLPSEYARLARAGTYLSCWHMNSGESGAMWAIYGAQGMAIESTVAHLKAALDAEQSREIHLGVVRYGDPSDPEVFRDLRRDYSLHKRQLYEYEHELRAAILTGQDPAMDDPPPVIKVDIHLPELIKRVWIGPKQPGWFETMVNDLLRDYQLPDIPVVRSTMDDDPLLARSIQTS